MVWYGMVWYHIVNLSCTAHEYGDMMATAPIMGVEMEAETEICVVKIHIRLSKVGT